MYVGKYEIECGYPLVTELARICFELDRVPEGKSIEDLFAEAAEAGNFEPLGRLSHILMKADNFLASRLSNANPPSNCYATFFERFKGCSFLTFNYDSLIEIFLLRNKRWHPHNGYGVPVLAELLPVRNASTDVPRSESLVLHLHGSLCLYTLDSQFRSLPSNSIRWIVPRQKPEYIFDPDAIATLFAPYTNMPPLLGYRPIGRRVIAPVPDKVKGLQESFIRRVYMRALKLLSSSSQLIVIGYSFNPLDKASYAQLINHFSATETARALLVAPQAVELKERLVKEYKLVNWSAEPMTFKSWVESGFPGVAENPR